MITILTIIMKIIITMTLVNSHNDVDQNKLENQDTHGIHRTTPDTDSYKCDLNQITK